nr:VOC family protein [Motilibacter aurantiacus]
MKDVCIDAADAHALARWWAPVLGYHVREDARPGWTAVPIVPPGGVSGPGLWFNQVPEPKSGKNRVHLDVEGDWRELVAHGATVLRGEGAVPEEDWVVLADPEGNEFCVFAPPAA